MISVIGKMNAIADLKQKMRSRILAQIRMFPAMIFAKKDERKGGFTRAMATASTNPIRTILRQTISPQPIQDRERFKMREPSGSFFCR